MRGQAGFSLIEVLLATVIMGVGLVGLMKAMTASITGTKDAEEFTTAVMLAHGHLETLRMDSYLTEGETESDASDLLPRYKIKQVVKTTDLDGLYEVTVSVLVQTLDERKSIVPVYELTTLMFNMPARTPLGDDETEEDRARRGRPRERRTDG